MRTAAIAHNVVMASCCEWRAFFFASNVAGMVVVVVVCSGCGVCVCGVVCGVWCGGASARVDGIARLFTPQCRMQGRS